MYAKSPSQQDFIDQVSKREGDYLQREVQPGKFHQSSFLSTLIQAPDLSLVYFQWLPSLAILACTAHKYASTKKLPACPKPTCPSHTTSRTYPPIQILYIYARVQLSASARSFPYEPYPVPSSSSMFQALTRQYILHTSSDSCVLDIIPLKLYPTSRPKENYTSHVLSQPSLPTSERPNEKYSHAQVALQKYKTYKNVRYCWPSPSHQSYRNVHQ